MINLTLLIFFFFINQYCPVWPKIVCYSQFFLQFITFRPKWKRKKIKKVRADRSCKLIGSRSLCCWTKSILLHFYGSLEWICHENKQISIATLNSNELLGCQGCQGGQRWYLRSIASIQILCVSPFTFCKRAFQICLSTL